MALMASSKLVAIRTAKFSLASFRHPVSSCTFATFRPRILSSSSPVEFIKCTVAVSPRTLHSSSVSPCVCSSSLAPAGEAAEQSPPAASSVSQGDIDALDIRVGKVLKAWKHPEADSLYVEEVDLAEDEGPRTICSGLVKYMTLEELEGRAVVVLANLKPRNMRGIKSNGMLLAASNQEHSVVQLLYPPEGAVPGERIWFGVEDDRSQQAPAGTPNQVQKKKIWENVQPLLRTTDECLAECQSKPMLTSAGPVRCESLKGANIA